MVAADEFDEVAQVADEPELFPARRLGGQAAFAAVVVEGEPVE
jgi:hypothetical protein